MWRPIQTTLVILCVGQTSPAPQHLPGSNKVESCTCWLHGWCHLLFINHPSFLFLFLPFKFTLSLSSQFKNFYILSKDWIPVQSRRLRKSEFTQESFALSKNNCWYLRHQNKFSKLHSNLWEISENFWEILRNFIKLPTYTTQVKAEKYFLSFPPNKRKNSNWCFNPVGTCCRHFRRFVVDTFEGVIAECTL